MSATDLTARRPDAVQTTAGPRTTYPLGWLRGLAALAVVFFHAYQHNRTGTGADGVWPFSGGAHRAMLGTELFVEMFFVLSGFVLWLPVARAALGNGPERPGWVLLFRRTARLLPLYYVVVLVVWTTTNPSLPGHWQDLLMHLTFTHVYSDDYIFWTIGPAWSLGVEFHFYALMALSVPLVAAGVRRASSRRGHLAVASALPVVLTVAGLGYLAWNILVSQPPIENWSTWFSPISRGASFGLGTALAVAVAAGVRLGAWARGVLAVVGLAALVALVATRPQTIAGEWWHPAYALAITVAMAAIVLHDGPWPRALEWRPLAWVGGLGYGIYLIHEPVMRFLGSIGALPEARPGAFFVFTAVLVAIPSIALAWVSSRTVEVAGLKLLSLIDRDGTPRDYYDHVRTR
ncbi:acyltransferase [Nocardioides sp. InS609-2]|uniref:acyltransferase family protein n=1 Tax=Nocardioides sp. InS609-2 TaxID=2760705 RepID=UPI0020C0322A|nr:acyltransferase [Nocardioides sp. InS609-2]